MLKIKNLNKKFGRKNIFANFTYEFNSTGLYVITGNSGVGKTTLLRIIAGLDKEYTGDVTGGGIGAVSMLFQEYRLFNNLNVLENITELSYPEDNHPPHEAVELLMRLGLSEEDTTRKISELSGGMKMRVSFARAVLKDSPILLLDEALKELDITSIEHVCQVIREEAKKRLVILVTHKVLPDLFGEYTELIIN